MATFNKESKAAMSVISKMGLTESALSVYSSGIDINAVSHSLVMNCGFSGWAKIEYMVVNGFLFGFSGSKICWQYPVKQDENGRFIVYEFNAETERILEEKVSNLLYN